MSVDYTLAPLDAGAPPAAAALQGVWVGSWDNILCSALIVENVSISGGIQAWYVYGRSTQWQIQQAGKQRWTGKLSDKKMSFSGARGGADYTLSNPSQLDGLYYSSAGQFKGSFTKK